MTSGEKIKAIRIAKGMTQKQVAEKCKMADSAIRKYESGKVDPKPKTIQRIADALGVPASDLFDDDYVNIAQLVYDAARSITSVSENAVKSISETATTASKNVDYAIDTGDMLMYHFRKLNHEGRKEATKSVQIIAGNPAFQKTEEESE